MVDPSKPNQPLDFSRSYAWILLAGWTAAFAVSLSVTVYQEYRESQRLALGTEPFQSLMRQHVVGSAIDHGLLWLVGLCGVGWGVRQLQRQATARRQFESELRENEFRLVQLTERQARLDAEHALLVTNEKLQLARQIQQRILPRTAPSLPGLDAAAILHSADATSGDFFDYLTLRDGSLGLVLADACGHGIGPALLAVETCAYLRALAGTSADVSEILRRLNEFLCDDMAEGFVTLFLARVDPTTRTLVFGGAGHGGYLVHPDGSCTTLKPNNLPLGIQPTIEITCSAPQPIEPGDIFVLFTDGVAETINQVGEMFGAQRALTLIQERRNDSADEIASALIRAVHEFAPDRPQADDITALILKVNAMKS